MGKQEIICAPSTDSSINRACPAVVHGFSKPWTTAGHALFSIISQTFMAERRTLQWQENEFCLHFTKWKIADRDSRKKRNVWSAPEEKQILLISSELEIVGTSRRNHETDRCWIFCWGVRISLPIFFDQLITWEPNNLPSKMLRKHRFQFLLGRLY